MRWLRHKQPAQNFVEFGVMVAAVALVAVVGLEFLSGTIRWYFGDIAPVLAPPAVTVPGGSLHDDTVVLTCGGSTGPITIQVGQAAHCNLLITDTSTPASTPTGSILEQVSGDSSPVLTVCSLGGTGATASCGFDYTPGQTGAISVSAKYQATSKHQSNPSNAVSLNVVAMPDLQFESCKDVNTGTNNTVQVGYPMSCQVRLSQKGPGASGISGKNLTFTLDARSAEPAQYAWFACSADPAWLTGCSAPADASSATCTTDSNGRCVVIFRPEFDFLRSTLDGAPGTAIIDVSFGGDSSYAAITKSQSVSVIGATSLHSVAAGIACTFAGQQATCTLTMTDTAPLPPTPPAADHYDRSPPGGPVNLNIQAGEQGSVVSSSCAQLAPLRPSGKWTDSSTCTFTLQSTDRKLDIDLDYDGEERPAGPTFLHDHIDATIRVDFQSQTVSLQVDSES